MLFLFLGHLIIFFYKNKLRKMSDPFDSSFIKQKLYEANLALENHIKTKIDTKTKREIFSYLRKFASLETTDTISANIFLPVYGLTFGEWMVYDFLCSKEKAATS